MADERWEAMTEQDFETLLAQAVPDLPPDDVAKQVGPWRQAMARILWGLGLSSITVHFFYLNFILPSVGLLLLLLGFRTLRRENRWLRLCWQISIVRVGCQMALLILYATIWYDSLLTPWLFYVQIFLAALQLLLFLAFWLGLREVGKKAGGAGGTGSAAALLIWNLLILALGLVQFDLIWGMLGMLILYVCILVSLWKLSGALDEVGYVVESAPVKRSDRALSALLAAVTAAGILCVGLLFHSYPMDWQEVTPTHSAAVEEVKGQLLDLGFPREVLRDLTDEDILALRGARRILTGTRDHPVNEGREVKTVGPDGPCINVVYDVNELRITGVAVELPGDRETWQLIHHFRWVVDPGFYGTESIQLWSAERNEQGWQQGGPLTGRLLYDRDGRTYEAPYYFLGNKTYTQNSMFFGPSELSDLFAAFSMPRRGADHRGYLSYPILEVQDGWIIDSGFNYTHQLSPFQYPVETAMGNRMRGSWNLTEPFQVVRTAIQFYPFCDGTELFGYGQN